MDWSPKDQNPKSKYKKAKPLAGIPCAQRITLNSNGRPLFGILEQLNKLNAQIVFALSRRGGCLFSFTILWDEAYKSLSSVKSSDHLNWLQ